MRIYQFLHAPDFQFVADEAQTVLTLLQMKLFNMVTAFIALTLNLDVNQALLLRDSTKYKLEFGTN